MKRLLIASLALALLVPACALAQDAFTGSWKMDASTFHQSGKPLVIHLKDGTYRCNCTPPITIKADGQDHAVSGHADFDSLAVKVVDDHTIHSTEKLAGKVTHDGTFTVAADGKTATSTFTNYRDGVKTFGGSVVYQRVAKGAAGSNAMAGTWRMGHVADTTGNMPGDTYKVAGDDISYNSANFGSYSAKIDGKAVPFTMNGKQDGTVAVKRLGKDTLRETYAKDGKVTLTSTMTLAADGKTMHTSNHDMKTGVTTTWVDNKQ